MARIMVLGGGLIGCGLAAAYAGGGHETWVVDPDPQAASRLGRVWQEARPVMAALGIAPVATAQEPPRHVLRPQEAPLPDLVHEALPEDLALKHRVLVLLEDHIDRETPVASCSSGFTPGAIAQGMRHGARLFIAHPCNPPYLMPTIELVAQEGADDGMLDAAQALFEAMGKTVLRMAKPMQGHLVNRLQFALWREAVHLVASGAARLEDVERAVSAGLGPRWCLMGPGGVFHLSGGEAGIARYLDALGPATEAMWADLGAPALDAPTRERLCAQMQEADARPVTEIAAARDHALPQIMQAVAAIRSSSFGEGGNQ